MGLIHHGHIFYTVTRVSIYHATPANVLVSLKDVKYDCMKGSGSGCLSIPPWTWTLEDGFWAEM